ncbi:MAG: BLUF domain-containing protein [Chloroflexi bacterium]|nr:BLUF domain-containing protein [Chloroflexota bacterium]NOG65930.1 BLUF domain-containing protein [Chloroflexota bacterium]
MINLIYASSATEMLTEPALLEILEKAREKNARLGITGMLLYRGGNFLQVLEGEDESVRELYKVIRQDQRHKGVMLIAERPVSERNFAEWKMAFVNLQSVKPEDVPGYSEYLNVNFTGETFSNNPTFAHRLLRIFRDYMR